MKVLKTILIVLTVLVIVTAVLFGLAVLFKACGWAPSVTDWLDANIFSKLGIDFYATLGK